MLGNIRMVGIAVLFILCVFYIQESICQKDEARCGQWQYGACEKMNKNGGKCGRGSKKATRSGDSTSCRPLEKNVQCKVPCAGDKKVCKYRKGQWSECDGTILKRVRTDTLMSELSDPSCDTTRPFEKACKKKLCQYGPWADYGPCENGHQTRSRQILSGTQEQCGVKGKKTKRCTSSTNGAAAVAAGAHTGRTRKGGAATGGQ